MDATVDLGPDATVGPRIVVDWAACQPEPGRLDLRAVQRHVDDLRAATDAGLEPTVVLHRGRHPAWLGPNLWLHPEAPYRFTDWVQRVVPHLVPHARRWTTIDEVNVLGIGSQLAGTLPPGGRRHPLRTLRVVDAALTAHVLAYDVIHRHQPEALVATSTRAAWPYEVDRVFVDVLTARSRGAGEPRLLAWLEVRRADFGAALLADQTRRRRARHQLAANGLRTVLAPEWRLPRTVRAVYDSPHERCLDRLEVHHRPADPGPGRAARRTRRQRPERWAPAPSELADYVGAYATEGLDLWVHGPLPPTATTEPVAPTALTLAPA